MISHLQNNIFFVLLICIWGITGVKVWFNYGYKIGIGVIIFGIMFLSVLKIIQNYSKKMLMVYNQNLKKGGK